MNRREWRKRRAQVAADGNPFRDQPLHLQNRSSIDVPDEFLPDVWELPDPDERGEERGEPFAPRVRKPNKNC